MKIIKNKNYKYYLYCLLLSSIIILFTSKCSYLYKFNDWVDANAFFTVGKSMMNGVIPYRDLFEQKGLILYIIYGIGYLLSNTTFHGIFIIEVISFSIFLYYAYKIIDLYFDKKYAIIMLPIISILITTSRVFIKGGSCEELTLPFLMVSLYYFIKHFKEKELSTKEIIINGIMSGIVFMMKYSIVGLFIGFVLCIFIDYLIKKDIKKAFIFSLKYLICFLIPIILCCIYLYFNNSLIDFYNTYFKFNVLIYSEHNYIGILDKIVSILVTFIYSLIHSGNLYLIILLIMMYLYSFKVNKEKRLSIYLVIIFITSGCFIYFGNSHPYYALALTVFIVISLINLFYIFRKYIDNFIKLKYYWLIILLIIPLCYFNANYKKELYYSEEDYFQFKYRDYINKNSNATLLNYGALDVGVYTVTGIIPNVKYFELQNIYYKDFPDNLDEMDSYIKNKKIDYIVYVTRDKDKYTKEELDNYHIPDFVYDNYEIVYKDDPIFDNARVSLFEIKNKCPLKK